MLDKYPNFYLDTAARVPAIGRHSAETMRAFFIKYQDRILFATDTGVGTTQLPLVLGAFRDESASGVPVSAVVRADLERSGVFRVLDAGATLDERSAIDAAGWRAKAADSLLSGSVQRLADGRFDVRYRLYDLVRNEPLLSQSKVVLAPDLRLAAHRIADEIHQRLTGTPGVFATRLVFVVRAGKRYTLHVTDADGEGAQVALSSAEPIISPAWSPDGKKLAYVSFEDQKAVVWVQELATGARQRVANFRGSNSAPAWAPDAQRLAVALSQEGSTQLYTLPVAGGAPQRITRSTGIDTEPVYAPDGQSLYFVSDRGGGPQIYRMATAAAASASANGTGAAAERVTFNGNYNISPTISPDGKLLAYITRQGSAYRLVSLDLSQGTLTTLTDTQDDESPSFAPNGRLLMYATRMQGQDVLMTTTLDGKFKTRLISTGADMREPAWGPYGR